MGSPQCILLLLAMIKIQSGGCSSHDLETFTKRHSEKLNQALGQKFKRWKSDASFLNLLKKALLQQFGEVPKAG